MHKTTKMAMELTEKALWKIFELNSYGPCRSFERIEI